MFATNSTAEPTGNERPDTVREGYGRSFFDPFAVTRIVWSLRWLIILATLLGLVGAIFFALSTPKIYTASAQVLIDPRDIKVVQNDVTPNGLPGDATLALIQSQIAVVNSTELLKSVIQKADLTQDPEFNGRQQTFLSKLTSSLPSIHDFFGSNDAGSQQAENERLLLKTMAVFRRHLKVSRDPQSFVLSIDVSAEEPQKAADLSNLVARTFIAMLGQAQSATARKASDALSSRLAELRGKVTDAEQAVEDYKAQHQLVGVDGKLVDDSTITSINNQLSSGRANITALRVKADQMRTASVQDVVQGTFPEALSSNALNQLRQRYSELEQTQASLASTLGPRHPQIIANRQALSSVRSAIRAELARIVAGAQTELARAEQTNADLSKQLDTLKTKQIKTSGSFVKLRELQREVDASRAVYEAFLLRSRETGEQERIDTANVRLISQATPPLLPSSLSRVLTVLLGGVIGFILGLGIALLIALVRSIPRASSDRTETALAQGRAIGRYEQAHGNEETMAQPVSPSAVPPSEKAEVRTHTPSSFESASVKPAPSSTNVGTHTRRTLRERVRALSAEHDVDASRGTGRDADMDALQMDIAAVREQIAGIRSRRRGGADRQDQAENA